MNLLRVSRNLLLTLFLLYYSQGTLYNTGSVIAKISLLLIFLISGIYFVKSLLLKNKKGVLFYTWTSLLLLNIIVFLLTGDFSNIKHTGMFKNILGCLLPFYSFYYFAFKNELKAKHLVIFFIILLPLTIAQYFVYESSYLTQFGSSNNDVVNNIAYSFVLMMPFTFLIKNNKIISSALMLLLMFFIIQGAKRGAMIAGSVCLLIYFYYQFKTIGKRRRVGGYIITVIIVVVMSKLSYDIFIGNEFLIQRLTSFSEGNSSGRDMIYLTLYKTWLTSEHLYNQIFGFGFASSVTITGEYAHSDWLELLSNFGLVGIFVYLLLFYSFYMFIRKKEWMIDKRIIFLSITAIWLVISLVSMWYTSLGTYTQSIILAYLIGSRSYTLN